MSWTIFDGDAMGVWFIFARSAQGLRNEKDVNTSTRVWLTGKATTMQGGGNRVDSSQREGAREMDEKNPSPKSSLLLVDTCQRQRSHSNTMARIDEVKKYCM
jgi:hypothetical protein